MQNWHREAESRNTDEKVQTTPNQQLSRISSATSVLTDGKHKEDLGVLNFTHPLTSSNFPSYDSITRIRNIGRTAKYEKATRSNRGYNDRLMPISPYLPRTLFSPRFVNNI